MPRFGLHDLAERYDLSQAAVDQLGRLCTLLERDPTAPTAIRAPELIVRDHFADSLVALELPELHAATELVDIGAGAGLPGLALAVAMPLARITLLESSRRKCAFMLGAIDACGIDNARVVVERAESWQQGLGAFDLATARALAPLSVVAEYAAPLLRVGGALVAWRGAPQPEVELAARFAAGELGLSILEPRRVQPYPGAEHRYLHVMLKVMETPPRFPRRPGVARKRPLGAQH